MRPTLFLSDLHLSPARPALVAAFHAFCEGPARQAAGIYLLGDLFDDWIGDDQLREPLPAEVAGALKSVTDSGVAVGVVTGNRDFLLGDEFAHLRRPTTLSPAAGTFVPQVHPVPAAETKVSPAGRLSTMVVQVAALPGGLAHGPATEATPPMLLGVIV